MGNSLRWLTRIIGRSFKRNRQKSKHRYGLSFEFLEDRNLPATWTWTGSLIDQNWSNSVNWIDSQQQHGVPTAADNVVFSPTYNVDSTVDPGFSPTSVFRVTIQAGYSKQITLQKDITVSLTEQNDGTIFGSYAYTVPAAGTYEWNGGTLRGFGSPTAYNTVVFGEMIINSSVTIDGRNIQDNGTVNWNAGTIDLKNSGRINVKPGGLFSGGAVVPLVLSDDGSGRVSNEGELRIIANSNVTFKPQVENFAGNNWNAKTGSTVICDGPVIAATGSVLLIEANAAVQMNGAITMQGGSNIQGEGAFSLANSMTVTASTAIIKAQATFQLGSNLTLGGELLISAPGNLTHMGGIIQGSTGSAQLHLAAGVTMDINGDLSITDATLANDDLVRWNAGNISLQNAAGQAKILNNAAFSVNTAQSIIGGGLFNNGGSATLHSNANGATIACTFNNLGLIFLAAGNLIIAQSWTMPGGAKIQYFGGNLQVNGTFDLQGSIFVTNSGSLYADLVVNNGIIDMRNSGASQILTIDRRPGMMGGGDYTQGTGGALYLEINGHHQNDLLLVIGQATLAGLLDISLGGGYQPDGDQPRTWGFLRYAGVNGTFGTVNRPPNFGMPVYDMLAARITWTPPG